MQYIATGHLLNTEASKPPTRTEAIRKFAEDGSVTTWAVQATDNPEGWEEIELPSEKTKPQMWQPGGEPPFFNELPL